MTMVMMMVIMPMLMLMTVMMIMILMMGGDGNDEMLDPKWDIDIIPSKADGDGDNLN